MPTFKVSFSRNVTVIESVERVIDAPDVTALMFAAGVIAATFNRDCPGDTEETGFEAGDWDSGSYFVTTDAAEYDASGNPIEIVADAATDLRAAAQEMATLMQDVLGVHVYSTEDGEMPPADCEIVASIQRVRAALGLPAADIATTSAEG